MTGLWIWFTAAVIYLAFRAWYDNWRGPLRPEEMGRYLERIRVSELTDTSDLDSLRRFMEEDDGREFIMLNLVRLNPESVPDPETGELTSAGKLLSGYLGSFLPKLLRRAGHPLLQAKKVGGYIDTWNVEPDPGWSFMGYMRYRSRRDLLELVLAPEFSASHPFKMAAMPNTFSFPTQPVVSTYAGPRIWAGLVLALVAALAHLIMLSLTGS